MEKMKKKYLIIEVEKMRKIRIKESEILDELEDIYGKSEDNIRCLDFIRDKSCFCCDFYDTCVAFAATWLIADDYETINDLSNQ